MSSFVEKVRDLIGIGEDDYESEYDLIDDNYDAYDEPLEPTKTRKINNNVVNLHTTNSMKIVVHEPLSYEEAPTIINDLKMRKTVVVNLEQLDTDVKKQIFNFINGGLYSLEGNIQKVTTDIFVLAPKSVEIDGLKDELKNKGIFSW